MSKANVFVYNSKGKKKKFMSNAYCTILANGLYCIPEEVVYAIAVERVLEKKNKYASKIKNDAIDQEENLEGLEGVIEEVMDDIVENCEPIKGACIVTCPYILEYL